MSALDRPRTGHEQLQAAVVELFTYTGWEHLHVRKSVGKGSKWVTTTNLKGWPDLAPCWNRRQPGRILAIEIKVPPDTLSDDQVKVRDALTAAGFEFYVIEPRDLERLPTILKPPRVAR